MIKNIYESYPDKRERMRHAQNTFKHISREYLSFFFNKLKRGESIDSIALYYYNNPTYYWMICDFNFIDDPFIELTEGQKIKVPTFSAVTFD